MKPVYSINDLKTPEGIERVLRQFSAAIGAIPTAPQSPDLNALALKLAPIIRDELQAGGASPLNLQSLPGSGVPFAAVDTHANRLAIYPAYNYPAGALFFESDRTMAYVDVLVSGVPTWEYSGGVYTSTFANRPADLVSTDIGFLFYATDQGTAYIWTGAAWNTTTRRILIGGFFGIFTHANAADRTYTLPDATGNITYETAVLTLNNFLFGGGGALVKDAGFSIVPVANGGTGVSNATQTYTPTLTGTFNITATTAYQCQYMRVGSTVVVSGRLDADPTAAGITNVRISLPIASAVAATPDVGGTASAPAIAGQCAAIYADVGNAAALMQWTAVDVTNQQWAFIFMYRIV